MWHERLEDWLAELRNDHPGLLGHDEWTIRNRLRAYPPLFDIRNPKRPAWDETGWIAHEAAGRARQLAERHSAHHRDSSRNDIREFRAWLVSAGYREALRLALTPKRIDYELASLPEGQSRLLRYRYLESWTDEELAIALRFSLASDGLVAPAEIGARSLEAYRAFCACLRRGFPVGGQEVECFFPLYPGGAS